MNSIHLIVFYLLINQSFSQNSVQFCDRNAIDAVLWDGITYRVTRGEWIATYDTRSGTMGQFVDKGEYHFPKEKGLYYQSIYHIPTVPECSRMLGECQKMSKLSGTTIFTMVRHHPSNASRIEVFNRIAHNGKHSPKSKSELKEYIETRLLPKGKTPQRYRPSVYSPKHYSFVHITNRFGKWAPTMQVIELKSNGTEKKLYYILEDYKEVMFVTSFWWTEDQNVYIVGQSKTMWGFQYIYRLDRNQQNVYSIEPMNMTVLEFFHCPTLNRSAEVINELANQITEEVVVKTPLPDRPDQKTMPSINISNQIEATTPQMTEQTTQTDRTVNVFNLVMPTQTSPMAQSVASLQVQNEPDGQSGLSQEIGKVTSLSDFWKLFPTIIMFALLVLSLLILIIGFFMVKNLSRFLSTNVNSRPIKIKSFDGLKVQRMKYSDDMNDFFIEEVYTSPKRGLNSCDSTSTQTIDSFRTLNHSKKSLQSKYSKRTV